MITNRQMRRCKIIRQVAERIIEEKEKRSIVSYGYDEEEDIKNAKEFDTADYIERHSKDRFDKSLAFLHMSKPKNKDKSKPKNKPKTKSQKYKPVLIDIMYIIALQYDIGNSPDWKRTLNRIIHKKYEKLDANQLASFFMPFYETEHWHILKSMNKKDAEDFKDFLHKHEETIKLFTKLWKLDIKCYKENIRLLCISFYNHNDLPSKEDYQKMLDSYKNN